MVNTRKVKARMVELGLTQGDVAKILSIDYATLNLKLNNKRRFYVDELNTLSQVLHISTSKELKEFFGLDFLIVPNTRQKETDKTQGGA